MSRIYFHNIERRAEVRGSERALFGNYCSRALLFALGDLEAWGNEPHWILKYIPPGHYLHEGEARVKSIETWLNVGSMSSKDNWLDYMGKQVPLFDLQLNSAHVMGSNALKLAARLHGQCEIHCYVEGPNRKWLADMIDAARVDSIFRGNEGWEGVIALLRHADDSPVVCSYSVCEQFPGYHIADWTAPLDEGGEPAHDAWYDLPHEKQWELSMAALRAKNEHSSLEMKPETWDKFYYGKWRTSGFDIASQR